MWFRLKYKCARIDKETYIEFDGVTLKQIKQHEGGLSTAKNVVTQIPHMLKVGIASITRKIQI